MDAQSELQRLKVEVAAVEMELMRVQGENNGLRKEVNKRKAKIEVKAAAELARLAEEAQYEMRKALGGVLTQEEVDVLREAAFDDSRKSTWSQYETALSHRTPAPSALAPPEDFAARVEVLKASLPPTPDLCPTPTYIQSRYPDTPLPPSLTSLSHKYAPWVGTIKIKSGHPDIVTRAETLTRPQSVLTKLLPNPTPQKARVLILVAVEGEQHPYHRISVLVTNVANGGKDTKVAYGSEWEERDGTVNGVKDLGSTAMRGLRDATGCDVTTSVAPRPLVDMRHGENCCSYFVADFSNEPPHVYEMMGVAKEAAGLSSRPELVTLHRLLQGGDSYDPELVLAATCLRQMMEATNGHKLREGLQAVKGLWADAKQKEAEKSIDAPVEQFTEIDALGTRATAPLSYLNCPSTPAALPPRTVTFTSVVQALLLAHPEIDTSELYTLLSLLGLHEEDEICYQTALTIRKVVKGTSELPNAKRSRIAP